MTAGGIQIPSVVYVDGFNLYYGAVKGTLYKWLDISKMVQLLLPKNQVLKIKYFTALVNSRPQDPDQPLRQQMYLRALKTIPNLEIILGHFLSHEINMPLANCAPGKQKYAKVIKTEEKGSDVNIATHLLHDGYQGLYGIAIVISNDSDLVEAIRIVRNELKKGVIVLNPFKKTPSQELKKAATFVKPIRQGVLAASQFPSPMKDSNGTFNKPSKW
ncbi:MAG: NYN domain-containing protein [Anaerolineaceae bacterium]